MPFLFVVQLLTQQKLLGFTDVSWHKKKSVCWDTPFNGEHEQTIHLLIGFLKKKPTKIFSP